MNEVKNQEINWDIEILPDSAPFSYKKYFESVWRYKDLILLLVKRDFVSQYKQTILGPIWFFISPLITTFTFFFLLSKIGNVQYHNTPPLLFIFSGLILWNYFSETFIKISETFISNSNLFGKVYFPRTVIPISIIISGLYKLGIQFTVLLIILIYYVNNGFKIDLTWKFIFLPLFIFFMAIYAFSLGLILCSITVKFRDIRFLVPFLTQLVMFFSSVVYDISGFSNSIKFLYHLNPFTDFIEGFREVLIGKSDFRIDFLVIHLIILILLFLYATRIFQRREKNFLDTI